MTTTEIVKEINTLPLARNSAVEKLSGRLNTVAANLEKSGISVRRGGCNRGTSQGSAYLYATLPGETEQRVWECVVKSSGYFTPISGKSFGGLLDTLESLVPVNEVTK